MPVSVELIPIESHETTGGGILNPYYRDWEEHHKDHRIAMVYTTTMKKDERKGPILHRVGTQLLTCVSGDVNILVASHDELREDVNNYHIHCLRDISNTTAVIRIPPLHWYELVAYCDSIVMNMPNLAWRPDYSDQARAETWQAASEMIV